MAEGKGAEAFNNSERQAATICSWSRR